MKIHFSSSREKTMSLFSFRISRDWDSCQGLVDVLLLSFKFGLSWSSAFFKWTCWCIESCTGGNHLLRSPTQQFKTSWSSSWSSKSLLSSSRSLSYHHHHCIVELMVLTAFKGWSYIWIFIAWAHSIQTTPYQSTSTPRTAPHIITAAKSSVLNNKPVLKFHVTISSSSSLSGGFCVKALLCTRKNAKVKSCKSNQLKIWQILLEIFWENQKGTCPIQFLSNQKPFKVRGSHDIRSWLYCRRGQPLQQAASSVPWPWRGGGGGGEDGRRGAVGGAGQQGGWSCADGVLQLEQGQIWKPLLHHSGQLGEDRRAAEVSIRALGKQ